MNTTLMLCRSAMDLNILTAEPIGDLLSWDGGADSFYEVGHAPRVSVRSTLTST